MITLAKLILNEVKDCLGREPSTSEVHALSEYLATKRIQFFVDLEWHIKEWANKQGGKNE